MSDGFDDSYENSGKNDISHSNIRKIPKERTAIALTGAEGGKKVPRIAAAGRGEIAQRIIDLAYENNIKVREDGDLAKLLASIEIDSPIPSEAFMAVGEILAYVYRANGQKNPFDDITKDDT